MLMQTFVDPTAKRFNNVWYSDPVAVPVDLVQHGEWVGLGVVYNMGRLKSLDSYWPDVMGDLDKRRKELLHRARDARREFLGRWKGQEQDDGFDDAYTEFMALVGDLSVEQDVLQRRMALRLADYLIVRFDNSDGDVPRVGDEDTLDVPELLPILEWAVSAGVRAEVGKLPTGPLSPTASAPTSLA